MVHGHSPGGSNTQAISMNGPFIKINETLGMTPVFYWGPLGCRHYCTVVSFLTGKEKHNSGWSSGGVCLEGK